MVKFIIENESAISPIGVTLEQKGDKVSINLGGVRVATFAESGTLVLVALEAKNKAYLDGLGVKFNNVFIKVF